MSASLFWRPVHQGSNQLPDPLKFAIRERFFSDDRGPVRLGYDSMPYLEGLNDANVEGAKELIDAIEKHSEVEVWLEY